MKKRIISILLSVIMTVTLFPSFVLAEDTMNYSYSDVYNNSGEKIGVRISGSSQTATGTISIPSEYEGYPVVEIQSLNAKNVTGYVIPASVTSISNWAFNTWGGQLASIEVESGNLFYKSVDGVLYNADMTALIRYPNGRTTESFTIPEGVATITQNAFLYSNVAEINLPSSVSSIGNQAFYYSQKLNAVNVNEDNTAFSSQDGVLYDKNKTTLIYYPYNKKNITVFSVPETVTAIANWAFESGNYEIMIPASVNTIHSLSFSSWNHRVTVASNNPSFTSSNGSVFSKDMTHFIYHYFTGEESYTVPDGITDIGKVFSNCGYSTIILPEGITTIPNDAFSYSSDLEEIYLPSTVEKIGAGAFNYCDVLKTVNFAGSTSQWDAVNIETYGNDVLSEAEIICSDGAPSVPVEPEWAYENNVLTVTYSGKMRDYSYSSKAPWDSDNSRYDTTGIAFAGSPVTIGKYAFYNFYRIEKLTVPEGITTIGESAFSSCFRLKEVALPLSLISVGSGAFDSDISTVYYAGSQEDWNKIKISGYNSLSDAEIIFNQSGFPVDSLEWRFADGILTVDGSGNLPNFDSYSNVPWYAYANQINKIVVKGNFRYIGNNAFSNLPSLNEVVLPPSVREIGDGVFLSDSALETITLPQNIKSIGSYAFSDCLKLETINLPEGLTDIGYRCFENCVSLSEIALPSTVSLSQNVFPNCTVLQEIKVAEGNTELWAEDGILFGKDYDDTPTILCYPAGKTATSYAIPNNITTLGAAFEGNKYIEEITGGEALTSISGTFAYCSNLKSVALSDTIEYMYGAPFAGCTSFKELVLPPNLQDLNGVLNESSIEEVTIPASITYIEAYMFESCHQLKSFKVAENNPSYTSIDGVLFSKDRTTLIFYPKGKDDASYTIPTETTTINGDAFSANSHIIQLIISENVRNISEYAFSNMSSLNEVIIEKGLETIPGSAFYCCRNLSKITIPATVKTVENYAFYLDRGESASPVEVTYQGTQSSWNRINVYSANSDVFESENISFVVGIGDGVDWILKGNEYLLITGNGELTDFASEEDAPWYNASYEGDYLGEIHERIEAVRIDGGITAIGDNAFTSSYTALTDIYFDGTREEWNKVSIGNTNSALLNAEVHCTDDALGNLVKSGTISSTLNWSLYDSGTLVVSSTTGKTPDYYNAWLTNPCFPEEIHKSIKKLIIEEGITSIGQYSFAFLPMLYEVKLPSTLTTIEENAFYDCEKLTMINFPSSLTTLKGFNDCALMEFNIPSSVTVLDEMQGNLFRTATIPDSVASISNRIFSGCPLLEEINIGKNTNIKLVSINWSTGGYLNETSVKAVNVHEDNPYLYSVDGVLFTKTDNILRHYPNKKEDLKYATPSGTKGIGAYSFESVNKYLSSLTISEGVEEIEDYGIFGCTITEINLPTSLKSIGECGINGEISSINISEGLTSIGEQGISSSKLEQIILPKSLKEIGPEAFRGCSALKSVSIPDGVTSIGDYAFADTYKTFTIKIPASVTEIGSKILDNYDYYGSCSVYYGGTKEQLDNLTNNDSDYFRSYGSTSYYYLLDGYDNIYSGSSANKFGFFIDKPITDTSYSAGIEFSKNGVVTDTYNFGSYDKSGSYISTSLYTDSYNFDTFKLFAYDSKGTPIIETEVYQKVFAPDSVTFRSCTFDSGKLNAKITYDTTFKDCVMMLAIYDDERLVETFSQPVSSVQGETFFDISTDKDFTGMKAKAFLWESLTGMKPIGFAVEKPVGGFVLESEHPYNNGVIDEKIYTYNGDCISMDITFSSDTLVESGYDVIRIYDVNNELIGEYSGDQLANKTIRVPGNTVKIQLDADSSVNYYGYRTESIVINK